MSYPYILQGDNVTLVIDGEPYTINKTQIAYQKIVDAIKGKAWDKVKELVNPTKILVNYSKGSLSVVNGELFWKRKPFHNSLATRIVSMLEEGFDVDPMVNFMNNLLQNPSKRAVDELYGFLEKNSLPITPDGCFLAYKRVKGDYTDCHTGTIDNSIGRVVSMDRNEVDDNRDNTCSAGLHFCSHSYLQSFSGERTVIVKIDPRDVVSIPSDYDNAKGRTCRYTVIGEVERDAKDEVEFTKPVQSTANSLYDKPKSGTSAFYKGYSDGYNYEPYNGNYFDHRDAKKYEEGFDKGVKHSDEGMDPQYVYIGFKY